MAFRQTENAMLTGMLSESILINVFDRLQNKFDILEKMQFQGFG